MRAAVPQQQWACQRRRCSSQRVGARTLAASSLPADPLVEVRESLLSLDRLVRAVATVAHARGRVTAPPSASRVEFRAVTVRGALKLSVTRLVGTQAFTANYDVYSASAALDDILSQAVPLENWRVESQTGTLTLTRNARGAWVVHRGAAPLVTSAPAQGHDRVKQRVLDASAPVLHALGITTVDGVVRADKTSKHRQVDAFCRVLDAAITEALASGRLPSDGRPLRMVDLGCGNAYLTFAAHALLEQRGIKCTTVGIDVKRQSMLRNTGISQALGWADVCTFIEGTISGAAHALGRDAVPDVVLALHACDTATDDALAAAVRWQAPLVLCAPCCHHAIQMQLKDGTRGGLHPFPALTKHAMLRERMGDVLTDSIRAAVLSAVGYRVTVSDFVPSEHTPRNLLIRADFTRSKPNAADLQELDSMCDAWGVQPPLVTHLRDRLDAVRSRVLA